MSIRLAVLAALLAVAPAQAQTLLQETTGERSVRSNNQSIQQLQRSQSRDAQTQFELNQLRQDTQRSRGSPSIGRPGCPAGSVGC